MGACESLAGNQPIFWDWLVNLTLCGSLLATALRDLILVFPEPFSLLSLAKGCRPLPFLRKVGRPLRIFPVCIPEVHIKEPDLFPDRLLFHSEEFKANFPTLTSA